jgi:hypothetical protein
MAIPIVEQIVLALQASLETVSDTVPGLTVYRNHDAALVNYPALVLYEGDLEPYTDTQLAMRYRLNVQIEGVVNPQHYSRLGPDANQLYAQALKTIMQDITLGGLCYDIEAGVRSMEIVRIEGADPFAYFSLPLFISFFTSPTDPFVIGP